MVLLRSDDPETLETALTAAEGLVRANPDDLREVSIQFANSLMHLTNDYEIPDFTFLRLRAISAVAALCHVLVVPYAAQKRLPTFLSDSADVFHDDSQLQFHVSYL
jgi:hypothetical protein